MFGKIILANFVKGNLKIVVLQLMPEAGSNWLLQCLVCNKRQQKEGIFKIAQVTAKNKLQQ